jgi:hypothetical protein
MRNKDDFNAVVGFICFVVVVSGLGFLCGAAFVQDSGYRQGQIDALTGTVRYRLKDNADGTRVWVEIPDAKRGE